VNKELINQIWQHLGCIPGSGEWVAVEISDSGFDGFSYAIKVAGWQL